jgi:hypothetical protein
MGLAVEEWESLQVQVLKVSVNAPSVVLRLNINEQ